MTQACPPESELVLLLNDELNKWEEDAMDAHVAGCSECQHRLDELTRGQLVLTSPADAHSTRCVMELLANMPPVKLRLIIEEHTTESESEQSRLADTPDHQLKMAKPPTPLTAGMIVGRGAVDSPPSSFGRYEVRRPLGTGGFCSVYLAHDRQLDRPVAIKVLRAAKVAAADRESLLREARRLARLRHPAIITVHDVGVHEGQLYIVSDFLDGPNLGEWLRQNRPSWQDAASIAAAVADALAHAHARLIIHRDVKPDNILITAGQTAVLVDFGLALDQMRAGSHKIGVVSGTPQYMSPEQTGGVAHPIDGRSDIYSLGVVLYEMLCGHVPFSSDNLAELFRQIQHDQPQPPRKFVLALPSELERVCLKALAKRPEDRYSTATDLASDLRRIIQAMVPTVPTFACPSATYAVAGAQRQTFGMASRYGDQDAELRHVTVLACSCKLFDTEEYEAWIDTEDQARMLWAFQQCCKGVARRFEGTVVQCNQQGVLICFGYPVTYEDSARRAALSGLAILDELRDLGEQLTLKNHLDLGPWVGIHTGRAFAKTDENSFSLVGEVPKVAVRLKDVAERGQVVCTEATYQLIRSYFESNCLGSRKIRGVNRPLALFTIGAPSADPLDAREDTLTALIGRDKEVSVLLDRWERAREGVSQVVMLIGEPGIGKSRLSYTLRRHVQSQLHPSDVAIIEWHCSPYYQNTLLYPAREFLKRLLDLGSEVAPVNRFDYLVHRLSKYGLARPEVVPLFAALLSLPTDARFPALGLSPAREREETFLVLREWLSAHAARSPVLFVVEDLHWADASTVEFLRRLVTEGLGDPILTVLTFRPDFQTPWSAIAHQTSLVLNRLTRHQVAEMMQRKLGRETLPAALIDPVYDRSGGVPLFVEEFTGVVQNLGLLDRMREDGARAGALLEYEIPASLQDLVMARVDRVAGDREVTQLAAALGREFSYDVLAAVTTLDGATLQAELAKMVAGEILYVKGRWPNGKYLFRHAILQECLYKTLIKEKRQQFNLRIAGVLESQFPQTAKSQPELLAHHFTEAGLFEKAIAYWIHAGQLSRQRSANIEAIGHLAKGLELLAALPDAPSRDAQELECLNLLSSVYIAAQGYAAPEVGPIFRRLRVLSQRTGLPTQLFTVLRSAWVWNIVIGNFHEYTQFAREAMELAERINDPGILSEALILQSVSSYYRGDFASTHADCARAMAEYDDRSRSRRWAGIFGEDSGIVHRCFSALALWHLGYPDQSLRANAEMLQLARAIGQPCDLCLALIHKGLLYRLFRLNAEDAAEEAIAIATEKDLTFWHAAGTLLKAGDLLASDDRVNAFTLLENEVDAYRARGFRAWLPFHLGNLTAAYTNDGRFHEAAEVLKEALAIVENNNERFHEAELHRLKGELLLAESPEQRAEAEQCFHRAIEIARRQPSRAWQLRATMSMARLWQRDGRRDDATSALAEIYRTFQEGFTTPDLIDAAELLRELDATD